MPPRKTKQVQEKHEDSSDEETVVSPSVQQPTKPTKTTNVQQVLVKYNENDCDRVQLAQAINNLTIKGEQFMSAFESFSKFKELVAQLDFQIDSKKKEYKDLLEKLEKEYKEKMHSHQRDYDEKTKQLQTTYQETNRNLQNEYKNNQIETQQKLKEYELKGCNEVVKKFNMIIVNQADYSALNDTVTRSNKELDDLKKKFDASCNAVRHEERGKYEAELKRQHTTQDLTFKSQSAEMKAQLEQQKREITSLMQTIETLKNEIAEQRNLTKEIAQASAKAQITQKFGGKD